MKKEKTCPICQAFIDKNYVPEMVLHINKLIKSKQPTEILNKESGLVFTKYYYDLHREKCLINFEIPIEEKKVKTLQTKNSLNNKVIEILNTNSIIVEFRNMSAEEQEKYNLKLLKEIEHLSIYVIHHQFIHGRIDINKFKGFVPKDDIASLKIITDIILKNNDDDNQMFTPEPLQITRIVNEKPEDKQ